MKADDNDLMYAAQGLLKQTMEKIDAIKKQPYLIECSIEDIYGKLEDVNLLITSLMGDDK